MISKHRILFCLFIVVNLVTKTVGQTIGDYQSNAATMNWNSTTQWLTWNGTAWVSTATPPTTIASGKTVTILSGQTVTGNVSISNSGTITIAGTLINSSTFTITNNGILINNGVFTNNGIITNNLNFNVNNNLTNGASGSINNFGTITIASAKTFTNSGAVANNSTIDNYGTLAQNNTFTNAAAGVINNSGTITVLTAKTFTNNGTVNNNLTITFTGKLVNTSAINNSSSGTLTLVAAANTNSGTITNQGTFLLSATTTTTFTNTGTIINSGTITNSSTSTSAFVNNSPAVINNSGVITTGGSSYFKFNASSTYRHNFISSSSAIGKIPVATWAATSTCEIIAYGNGTVLPTSTEFPNQTFGNFIWNNSTQPTDINLNGRLLTIGGNFTVQNTYGSKLILRNTTGNSTAVNGSLNIPSTGNLVLTDGAGTSGSSNHTLTVNGNFNLTGGSFDLTSNPVTGANGNGYLNVGGNFVHTAGTFSKSGVTNGTVTINGTIAQTIESIGFTSGNSILFNIAKSGTAAASIATGKTFVINPATNFIVSDNVSSAIDFNINGTLTANTNTWSMTSGVTYINGTFINNVTSIIQSNSTSSNLFCAAAGIFRIAADGGQAATASWDATGTLEVTGIVSSDSVGNCNQLFGKILWNSTAQSSSASFMVSNSSSPVFSTQNDFTVSSTGTGILRFPDLDFSVGNDLIVYNASQLQVSNAPGLYSPSGISITINGNVEVSGTAKISVGPPNNSVSGIGNKSRDYTFLLKKDYLNTSSTPIISFDQRTFGGTTNNESYHLIFNFCGGISQNYNSTTGGNLTAGTLSNEFICKSPYSIIISNNSSLIGLSDIKYKSLLVNAGSMLDMTNGTYNLIQYPALTIANSSDAAGTIITGILDFGLGQLSDVIGTVGNFTLSNASTAELRTKHAGGIALAGNASGCILCSVRNYGTVANYTYNGDYNQVTGTGLPTALTGTLTIANTTSVAAGGVTLTQLTTLTSATGILKLTSGKLITTSLNLIVIGNTGSVYPVGGQSGSFVDGPIKKLGLLTSEFQFPTGDNDKWARIGVTAIAAITTDAFTAEYFKADPHSIDTTLNHTIAGRILNRISSIEYWNLSQSAGTPSAKVKLYWEDGNYSGISDLNDLRLAHYYNVGAAGLKWYSETAALPMVLGTIATGSIETAAAISSFSPFTFGSVGGVNPLPIELTTFSGNATTNGNQLNWITATEINNDYFDLQRSADGANFNSITKVKGQGNSSFTNNYTYLDEKPLNGINYYRLQQVDYNGDYTYSGIVAIDFKSSENTFVNIYPNPTVDNINIKFSDDIIRLQIFNMLGEKIYESGSLNASEIIGINDLAKGVYILKATSSDNEILTSRFIKK
jgi:hypothetical protein